MIWVFDVISNNISTGHTHCPTQSHTHMLYFRLSLPCVPRFSEGVKSLVAAMCLIKAHQGL